MIAIVFSLMVLIAYQFLLAVSTIFFQLFDPVPTSRGREDVGMVLEYLWWWNHFQLGFSSVYLVIREKISQSPKAEAPTTHVRLPQLTHDPDQMENPHATCFLFGCSFTYYLAMPHGEY